MNQDDMKRAVAQAALNEIVPGTILGVGTGSTVNHLIDLLADRVADIPGAVSSSEASTRRLQAIGIPVLDLNDVDSIPVYIDGADEVTPEGFMTKGGGGALTREKIVASASDRFVCIVDESKIVETLGRFPIPVEVIPMATSVVGRALGKLGGRPVKRGDFVTDNGNIILDIHDLRLKSPGDFEIRVNNIPGVVTCGVFASTPSNLTIVGGPEGIQAISP
ncbi:ribose-5-phosphate isomerase RpiA [uncultured Abyssibacter sp.]|uniref:ribose-5-phosphate isomerase RpiA n=1 Tax=uncultured Abyssibacter sp. TaxID=2320202 RepID=UPI0032B2287A